MRGHARDSRPEERPSDRDRVVSSRIRIDSMSLKCAPEDGPPLHPSNVAAHPQMTKPFSQCSLSDSAHEISLGMPATAALLLPSFTDEELQDYPYFAADILQRHPLVRGASGLLCSDTAESKRAWCSMLRDLFSASGVSVSDAVLFRVHDVCQNCARRGYVRLSEAAASAVVGDGVTGIAAERGQAQVQTPHIMFDLCKETLKCVFPLPLPFMQSAAAAAAAVLELRSLHIREFRPTQPSVRRVQLSQPPRAILGLQCLLIRKARTWILTSVTRVQTPENLCRRTACAGCAQQQHPHHGHRPQFL